mgnify:CR=1 FL=1
MQNDKIKEYWEGEAGIYSEGIKAELKSETAENWKNLILEYAPEKEHLEVLDVGCGPGFFEITLGKEGHHGTGIDITENMIHEAKENVKAAGLSADLMTMDCHNLNFPDETFDMVICRNITWTLDNPQKAYREWLRVLKKGGRLLVSDACWYLHLYDEEKKKRRKRGLGESLILNIQDNHVRTMNEEKRNCEHLHRFPAPRRAGGICHGRPPGEKTWHGISEVNNMNRKLKSLLAMVCVLALTLAMSVCAFAADTVTEDEVANYKSAAETLISQIAGFSDEEIENYLAQDDAFTTATMESWKSVKDELGAYSSIVSQDVEKDGDVVTISTVAQFEKAKADVVLMLDLGQQMYTSMTYSVQYSLAANMQRAGMNTLMGIGIVFLMLLFLSFVIGLFKYIEKFQNVGKKKAAEEAPKAEEAPAPAIAQSEAADEDFADDLELVAVISAAIAAYENTSGDSFVVRSIKKSNKWHRA